MKKTIFALAIATLSLSAPAAMAQATPAVAGSLPGVLGGAGLGGGAAVGIIAAVVVIGVAVGNNSNGTTTTTTTTN